jgi:hypothetical protein
LRKYIIPAFLAGERIGKDDGTAIHLYLALRYLIYAVILRLLTVAIEVAFNAFVF